MARTPGRRRLARLPYCDLRHTVVTDLLEAGEPEYVIETVTGHSARRMLEHYVHQASERKGTDVGVNGGEAEGGLIGLPRALASGDLSQSQGIVPIPDCLEGERALIATAVKDRQGALAKRPLAAVTIRANYLEPATRR
jgi:hypothetical protein